ncbi:hypothetical protein N9L92_03910 [Saprospiraceae bacterium]|nr:hypothetical protein [Saprospiraceae bacterium]
MKNLLFLSFSIVSLFIISCSDPCDDIDCGPGTCIDGTCDCPDGFIGDNCETVDLCFNADCGNGNCDEVTGDCICDEGFEGANCEIRIKDKFLGTWTSPDWDCMMGYGGNQLTFRFDDNPDGETLLFFVNPLEYDEILNTIIMSESFIIEEQTLDSDGNGNLTVVSGVGTLIDEVITLNLTFSLQAYNLEATCSGIFTRQ